MSIKLDKISIGGWMIPPPFDPSGVTPSCRVLSRGDLPRSAKED
jgi:hypothetical protein